MGWLGGTTITNLGNGQGGAADRFISVDSVNAGGPGSKVSCYNVDGRWAGNYITAGVTSIQVDMINLNTTTLQMRMVLHSGINRWTSTNFMLLAPGTGWQHFTFDISPASLTQVSGLANYAATLSNIDRLMFRHDTGQPSAGGESIDGTVGIDNVHAIPGPGGAGALLLAGGWAARRRRIG